MKRFLMVTSLGAILAAGATAQVDLRLDDGSTDFTSRGIGGGLDGWAIECYDILGVNETSQWFTVMQDQNCTTPEIFALVLFGESVGTPGTADETNVIASTGSFLSPTNGSTGACAWLYTVTLATPLAHSAAPTGHNIYTATFLPSNALWVSDGASSHISIHNGGGTPEYPSGSAALTYPPSTPGVGRGAVYGSNFLLGSGGGAMTTYPGSWRVWNRNTINMSATGMFGVAYDVRCGTEEGMNSVGLYAVTGVVQPNFGMAGRYPDFTNQTGTAPVREDNLRYRSNNPTFLTGVEQLFLSSSLLRTLLGFPVDLAPNQGRFELNTGDPLFNASLSLHPTQVVAAATVDHPLNLDLGIRAAFYAIPVGSGAVLNVYYQAVRIDLLTGLLEVSSCRQWNYTF